MEIRRRATYHRDVNRIVKYIAQENRAAVLTIFDEIEHQTRRLAQYPLSGRMGRRAGTRELVIPRTPFVVIYTVSDHISLVRVLHGSQQWPPAPVV